jgi:hypothetical protein
MLALSRRNGHPLNQTLLRSAGRDLEELYHAALRLAPERQPAFLQETCPDSGLRREVESLLKAKSKGERMLDGTQPRSPSNGK